MIFNIYVKIKDKDHICIKLNFDVEDGNMQILEEQLQETKRDYMTDMYARQIRFSQADSKEEIIYSEGEPFEELYPDNTWDTDEEVHDKEKSLES